MKEVVLLTGITGFLGSHVAKLLCDNNYRIIATRRLSSKLERCLKIEHQITWVNIDDNDWKEQIVAFRPATIIHAAWIGVAFSERDNWDSQNRNLVFLEDLLDVAKAARCKRIIGFGSQSEYGFTDKVVSELHPAKPDSAYGAVKVACSELLKKTSIENGMQWYWLRIFSVFGEGEDRHWLLPSVIQNIAEKKSGTMSFTKGEQRYAYMYVGDFARTIQQLMLNSADKSGVYNISGTELLPLRNLIKLIRDKIDPDFVLEFGALPYRPNQAMIVGGGMDRFNNAFGTVPTTPVESSIENTINFFRSKVSNESI